jgi:hypothetical protein
MKTHQQLARTSNGLSTEYEALVKQFVAERNAALLTLDEATIRAHMAKWNIRTPENPIVFWIGIHKARTACLNLPREARVLSKTWLMVRGYQSMDFGELDLKVV